VVAPTSRAISLTQHLFEMNLSVPPSAVDGLVQVISFSGFGIAAVVNAHQPSVAARARRSNLLSVP